MAKKVVFIGNRWEVLQSCLEEKSWDVTEVYAHKGSHLERELVKRSLAHHSFAFKDSAKVVSEIQDSNFDLLVSNGCPFILPVSKIEKPGRLFLNTHPSLLPGLKGPHPVNALFLLGHKEFGATTHFMTDSVDAGHILAQARMQLTPDLDAGIVYRLAFKLESEAFRQAIQILKGSDYSARGTPQKSETSFYKRKDEDMKADASRESAHEIERKIRAFGISSLGTVVQTRVGSFKVFDGHAVTNSRVSELLDKKQPGEVILDYDEKTLVQTKQDLICFVKFQKIN